MVCVQNVPVEEVMSDNLRLCQKVPNFVAHQRVKPPRKIDLATYREAVKQSDEGNGAVQQRKEITGRSEEEAVRRGPNNLLSVKLKRLKP